MKSWGMVMGAEERASSKVPETELVLASLRTQDVMGVW